MTISPSMNPDAVVIDPTITGLADDTPVFLGAGRQGEQYVSDVHGRYGVMASRGGLFATTAVTSGILIGCSVGNNTSATQKFAIVNPVGSGKNVEFCRFVLNFLLTNIAPGSATTVGWSVFNTATNAISGLTVNEDFLLPSLGGHPVNLGNTAPVARVYTALTLASALTVAANWCCPMFSFPASWVPTVGGFLFPMVYDFQGNFVLPPGWGAALTATTGWAADTVVPSLTWLEYETYSFAVVPIF
jgi:hypothetical protein